MQDPNSKSAAYPDSGGFRESTAQAGKAEDDHNARGMSVGVSYLTPRQRARMADLSLLLDVILKTTSTG